MIPTFIDSLKPIISNTIRNTFFETQVPTISLTIDITLFKTLGFSNMYTYKPTFELTLFPIFIETIYPTKLDINYPTFKDILLPSQSISIDPTNSNSLFEFISSIYPTSNFLCFNFTSSLEYYIFPSISDKINFINSFKQTEFDSLYPTISNSELFLIENVSLLKKEEAILFFFGLFIGIFIIYFLYIKKVQNIEIETDENFIPQFIYNESEIWTSFL